MNSKDDGGSHRETTRTHEQKSPAVWLIGFVKPYVGRVVLAILLTLLITVLNLIQPKLLQVFLDDVVGKSKWQWMWWISSGLFVIYFTHGVISYFNTQSIARIGQSVIFDLRFQLYRKLQQLSLSFYDKMSTGAIVSRMMDDVILVQQLLTGATINLVTDFLTLIFVVIILFKMNWVMTLMVFAILPLYGLNFRFFKSRIRQAHRNIREKMDLIMGDLEETISGAMVVKSFSKEKHESIEFVTSNREALNMNMKAAFLGMSFSSIGGLISGVGAAVTLCYGVWEVIHGRLTVGELTAFTAWAGYLYGPTARLTEVINTFQQAATSLNRIHEIFMTMPDVKEIDNAIVPTNIKGHVVFDNVSFGYNPEQKVVSEISLNIEPGTIVALVGHTGCGKTTLTSLLLRFYDVTSGKITIDQYDLRTLKLTALRDRVGVVLQDPVLFNESIIENIRYGENHATDEQVIKAAKIAEIHDFIMTLKDGYDTRMGEGGIKLSVGEKQRLSIARAVVGDPAILIMDEATSSLDSESEALIQKALNNVMKNKTCFIIAHRLSTIVRADLIVVMDKGRIIETGKHKDLVKKSDGFYARLYQQQFTVPLKPFQKVNQEITAEETPSP